MDTAIATAAGLSLLLGYLLGSIPFGLLLTRAGGAGDLRALGSGNIGATNVLRTGRRDLAAATLALDAFKGAAAVWIAGAVWPGFTLFAATGAFFGHLYPVWLRGRGGKGVATLLGLLLALNWPAGLVFVAVWLATLAATRYSSVAGIAASLSAPVAAGLFGRFDVALLSFAFAMLIVWKHRANMERLMNGTEPAVGGGRKG